MDFRSSRDVSGFILKPTSTFPPFDFECSRAHLSDASQRWIPPINDTDKVLQSKIMKYVRSDEGPPPPDEYKEEQDIADADAEPEL